jgi:nitroimidazol reductase NimA-like FMN-containing flavoprotein (pyridoxamine 5'-phosphate oxidase superfamily)
MDVDRNGLEMLDRDECLALLAGVSFGRVGLSMAALPVVLPVNFRLVDDQIVFSTAAGSKLRAATDHAVIAFEADHIDPLDHAGWSVLATGMARAVTDPGERDRLVRSGVPRWLSGDDAQLVVVGTGVISGRRLRHDVIPVGVAGASRSARMGA